LDPEPIVTVSFLKLLEYDSIISILILLGLLATSALISGAEVAFFALKPNDIDALGKLKSRDANLLESFLKKPKQLLATILIANNFVNVGIIILSTYISASLFNFNGIEWLEFVVQVVVITFLLLLFGEVLPKVYANNNAASFAKFMAKPLFVLTKILKPISLVLVASTRIIDNWAQNNRHDLSVNDLSNALEITSLGSEDKGEKKILEGIVKFGNTDVKQIMRSRIDVTSLSEKTSYDKILETIKETGFSRIPIYEESFDNIKGVLYIKDLLPYLNEHKNFVWTNLLREVFFVPENKKIDDLLKEFQAKKIHFAIVVDEYGGTSGIVTLEDIIEEIVGDISDEFDAEDIVYSKLDQSNYVFEGKTALNDFYRILNIDGEEFEESKGESDSLAGFILELTGNIPAKGEEIKFNGFLFTIEGVNKRRVTRIKTTFAAPKNLQNEN
tara:strand:- start:10399 stop:11730 length:1332 start_codon:yes stop_codon:yes gene_type:complete